MPKVIVAVILLMASVCSQLVRAEEAPLAACAKWVIDHGSDNAFQPKLARLLLDLAREIPVRQKAFQEPNGTFHVMDVTAINGAADDVFLIVANPEHTRNVFFVTRVDGVLRRTVASYEKMPASVIPNTAHRDLFADQSLAEQVAAGLIPSSPRRELSRPQPDQLIMHQLKAY